MKDSASSVPALEEIFTGNQRDAGASAEGARSREREIAHAASVMLDPVLTCDRFITFQGW